MTSVIDGQVWDDVGDQFRMLSREVIEDMLYRPKVETAGECRQRWFD